MRHDDIYGCWYSPSMALWRMLHSAILLIFVIEWRYGECCTPPSCWYSPSNGAMENVVLRHLVDIHHRMALWRMLYSAILLIFVIEWRYGECCTPPSSNIKHFLFKRLPLQVRKYRGYSQQICLDSHCLRRGVALAISIAYRYRLRLTFVNTIVLSW